MISKLVKITPEKTKIIVPSSELPANVNSLKSWLELRGLSSNNISFAGVHNYYPDVSTSLIIKSILENKDKAILMYMSMVNYVTG